MIDDIKKGEEEIGMNREEAKKKAEALVARMTLEEKASQLRYDAPAIKRLGIPAYNWWNEGLHGVARAGQATVFPQAIGMAAAFDLAGDRYRDGDGAECLLYRLFLHGTGQHHALGGVRGSYRIQHRF